MVWSGLVAEESDERGRREGDVCVGMMNEVRSEDRAFVDVSDMVGSPSKDNSGESDTVEVEG